MQPTRTATRLSFDEINALVDSFSAQGKDIDASAVIDGVLDYLIYAYVWGTQDVSDWLEKEISPDSNAMRNVIYKPIDGKTFEDRLREYVGVLDFEAIRKVAETEMHRTYNTAVLDVAEDNGALQKTWNTMLDNRVREDHTYLEGITVPIDADFYIGEHSAPAPGMFGVPELDINCRCFLTVSRG